ncbi:MAG: hypothetical protein WCR52_12805 [Bacteroidota bacterium]
MDAEKIKLIQAFNIDEFLDWQSQFYEPLPEWVEQEKTALEERVLENWNAYTDAVKSGTQIPDEPNYQMSEGAEQIIKAHEERRNAVELWEKLQDPIMQIGHFYALQHGVIGGIKWEAETVNEKIQRGISTPDRVLEKRLEEGIELINFNLLDWWESEHPILERHGLNALQSLIEIGVCKWIIEQTTEAKTPEIENKANFEKVFIRDNQKTAFYLWLKKAVEYGLFEMSYPKLGIWVKDAFEGFATTKPDSIGDQIKKGVVPMRNKHGRDIDEIFNSPK